MKKHKVVAEPLPKKFKADDRVKPTPEAVILGWTKPGVVKDCGFCCVAVLMDGESQYSWYSTDYWMAE